LYGIRVLRQSSQARFLLESPRVYYLFCQDEEIKSNLIRSVPYKHFDRRLKCLITYFLGYLLTCLLTCFVTCLLAFYMGLAHLAFVSNAVVPLPRDSSKSLKRYPTVFARAVFCSSLNCEYVLLHCSRTDLLNFKPHDTACDLVTTST